MLDINNIRNNKEEINKALLKRLDKVDLDLLIKLDDDRKHLISNVEKLKAERNKFSKTKPDTETISKMKKLGGEIKKLDDELNKVETEYKKLMSALPNIPADDVKAGDKENNEIIDTYSKQPKFKFEIKNHVDIF